MARRLRVQYSGAIYHVMARGNGRQDIVCDDGDRERLIRELGRAAVRCSWRVYAFVVLSNHLHIVLKTPLPNLARGMQGFLSAYANGWARKQRFCGHVFQGRYRTELIEDESYLWTVTRYVHLNPVRARLVKRPEEWPWSSYPGYSRRTRRLDWVAYDELLASWKGAFGGSDPAADYRRYVTAGIADRPKSPWASAHHGWLLGSPAFAERVGALLRGEPPRQRRRESRLIMAISLAQACEMVCTIFQVDRRELRKRGSRHPARVALAHLARQHTVATNAELAKTLGLSRPESVPNLTRRFPAWLSQDPKAPGQWRRLEKLLGEARTE